MIAQEHESNQNRHSSCTFMHEAQTASFFSCWCIDLLRDTGTCVLLHCEVGFRPISGGRHSKIQSSVLVRCVVRRRFVRTGF